MAGKSEKFKKYSASQGAPPSIVTQEPRSNTRSTGCASLPLWLLALALILIGMVVIGQVIDGSGLDGPGPSEPTARWVPTQSADTPAPMASPTASPEPAPTSTGQASIPTQVVQVIQPIPVVILVPVVQQPDMVLTQHQGAQQGYHQGRSAWNSYGTSAIFLQDHRPYHRPAYYQGQCSSSSHTYVVRHGDTVYGLARRFGIDPSTIVGANGLGNPNYIRTGQVLQIPCHARW